MFNFIARLHEAVHRVLRPHRDRLRSESGQSVILIATVIISFIMFFGFAVNTGLLVNAKISLQSAADAAAYAGAATQARQLNAISYLNYDMRRQYKKFLYRYTVLGAMGNPNFANGQNPDKAGYYDFAKNSFSGSGQATPLPINVPAVCIPLTGGEKNDACLQVNLPNVTSNLPKGGGLSQISQMLYQQMQAIQQTQTDLCQGNSSINLLVLIAWLFKAEHSNTGLQTMFGKLNNPNIKPQDLQTALNTASALTVGLGLFPRNLIHLLRINTMVAMLNEPPATEATLDLVQGWEKSPQADQHERTIQAVKSAIANLNESVMPPAGVVLQELQSPNQLQVTPVTIGFNTYVQYMRPGAANTPNSPRICESSILPFPVNGVPVGVRRADPNGVVHYAVKVKAKARLLFLPVKDGLELEAVAAAKPFGARIGPSRMMAGDFVENVKPGVVNNKEINDCSGTLECRVPNARIVHNGATFFSMAYLNTLKGVIASSAATPPKFDSAAILAGQKAAMAPNPSETGLYNILPPPRSSKNMEFEFIPYSDDKNIDIYRFYAPITLASQGSAASQIRQIIDQNFDKSPNNAFGVDLVDIAEDLKTRISDYINNRLANPNAATAEYEESQTFAAIELPMAGVKPAPPNQAYWLTEPRSVLTAWAPKFARIDGAGLGFQPRFGYSVKFVTMQNLLKAGMPATDDDLSKVNH